MYSIQAHDGPISALTYSVSYIISAGGDDKICIWERFQGHLLNTIHLVSELLLLLDFTGYGRWISPRLC